MTDREKLLGRVRKLRALAKSQNKHEADQAAAMAKELVDEHKLSDAELGDTTTTKIGEWPVEGIDFRPDWRLSLLTTIASRYGCRTLRVIDGSGQAAGILVGTKDASDVIAMIFRYFDGEIVPRARKAWSNEVDTVTRENLGDADAEQDAEFKAWMVRWRAGTERGYVESFCLGATFTIQDRILCGDLDLFKIWKEDGKAADAKDKAAEAALRARGAVARVDPKAVSRRLVDDHLKGRAIERFSNFGQASNRQAIALGKVEGALIGMPGEKLARIGDGKVREREERDGRKGSTRKG